MSRKKIGLVEIVAIPLVYSNFSCLEEFIYVKAPFLVEMFFDNETNFYYTVWNMVGIEAIGNSVTDAIRHFQDKVRRMYFNLFYLKEAKEISKEELRTFKAMSEVLELCCGSNLADINEKFIKKINAEEEVYLNKLN